MKFSRTRLLGFWLIDLELREDERGFLARTYCDNEFNEGFTYGGLQQKGFAWGRDIGVMGHGRVVGGKLQYQAGVFGGEGQNNAPKADFGLLYAARISVEPLGAMALDEADLAHGKPKVGIGVNASLNQQPLFDGDGDAAGSTHDARFAGEVRASVAGFAWTSEVYVATAGGGGGESVRGVGFFGCASYAVGPVPLLPAVRVSYADRDLDADGSLLTAEADVAWLMPDFFTKDDKDDNLGHKGKLIAGWQLVNDQDGPLVLAAVLEANFTL